MPRIPKIAGLDRQLPPHIEQRLSRAFDLAQRGATYSANIEFREVLSLCALELDSREGTTSHREAMRQRIATGSHAPGMYRALSLRNLDAWYEAFDVQAEDAQYIAPENRVRVW